MWTPQSDGKRERLCFIEHKDKSFVSNYRDFLRENILIFRSREGRNKNTGTFFDPSLVSLIAPPLSQVAFLLWGGKSVAAFSLHSAFVPFPVPQVSAPSRMTHARVSAHPRLAHSASFHFFAFTPHAQPTELLAVMGEGFCISTIYSGG